MKFILAKKVNMTQAFTEDGKVIPVTALKVAPCKVTKILTEDKDGYKAVQVSSGKDSREFRIDDGEYQVGQEIKISDFEPGEIVNISGTGKGRGTQGVVKRHGFHGFPASHGHRGRRAPGSIGQMFPQHVRAGLPMAGHMGDNQVTVINSMVIDVDPENNLLFVKGGAPGAPTGLVKVYTTGKKIEFGKLMKYMKQAEGKDESKEEPKEVKSETPKAEAKSAEASAEKESVNVQQEIIDEKQDVKG